MTITEISSERLEEIIAGREPGWVEAEAMARELRDRRAAGGEVVAWRCRYPRLGWFVTDNVAVMSDCRLEHGEAVPLYLHPSNIGVAVNLLEQVAQKIDSYGEEYGDPADTLHEIRNCAEIVRSFIHTSPDTGKSNETEGTRSDGGKEWTPDEVSFKAGWDKAKQLLKPEDLDGFDEATAHITELEEALRKTQLAAYERYTLAEHRVTELEEALRRIGAIEYPTNETYYALKATIDYAREQARAALGDAS